VIVFARWLRARRAAQHLGPVEWTLRPAGSTRVTLALLIGLYVFAVVAAVGAMGVVGLVLALGVCLMEARSVAYEVDERVEIRGDILVAHHHGHIEPFHRSSIEQVVRDDFAGVPTYGAGSFNPGFAGGVAAMLRIRTVRGRDVEIWRCASTDRQFAALDAAVDIIEIWRLQASAEPVPGRGEPPSPFYRAPD